MAGAEEVRRSMQLAGGTVTAYLRGDRDGFAISQREAVHAVGPGASYGVLRLASTVVGLVAKATGRRPADVVLAVDVDRPDVPALDGAEVDAAVREAGHRFVTPLVAAFLAGDDARLDEHYRRLFAESAFGSRALVRWAAAAVAELAALNGRDAADQAETLTLLLARPLDD